MSTQTIGIKIAVEGTGQAATAMKAVAKNVTDTGAAAKKANDLAAGLVSRLKQLAGIAVGGLALREFVQQADAMALLDARLRNAVGSGREFAAAQGEIYRISQANNIGLQEAAQLYIKLSDPVQRLGGTTKETAGIVDAFATSLRVGGASAQEASAATLQFAQAMASGKLSGDEFRSMAEASPRFMRALADGMGVPIEQLKEMSTQGKLTADVVGNALLKSLGALKAEAQGLPDTVGGALTRLQNDAMLAVAAFNEMNKVTGELAETIGLASDLLKSFSAAVAQLGRDTAGVGGEFDAAGAAVAVLGKVLETVVLIGSDVMFVLNGIGREIGGIAAQAGAVLSGDFAGAAAIRREMIADNERARAALDKFQASVSGSTDRILAQRDALKSNSLSAAENANEMARLAGRVGTAASGYVKLKSSVVDTTAASKAAAKAAKEATDAAKAQADLAEKTRKAMIERQDAYIASLNKAAESEEAQLLRLRDQYIELVAGKEVLAELVNLREEERAVALDRQADGTGWQEEADELRILAKLIRDQIVLRKGAASAAAGQEVSAANEKAAQDALADWQRTADQVGQSLADALMQGGKDAAEYITSLFRTMVLKPVIEAVTRPIGNAALGALGMGGSGSAFAGGGSSLSMLSGLGGALGTFGTTMGMGAAATMAGNSLAALSGAGSMIGAGNVAGGMGMGLGAVAPYLAGAYAIYSIAKSMDKSGTPHMGSVVAGSGPDLSTMWGDGSTILNNYSGGTDAALRGLVGSSTGILNALGGGGYSATARFAADNTDASIGQYQLSRGGQQVGYVGNGADYAKYSSDAGTGLQSFTADVVRVTREQLDALDLPGWAQDQLDNLAADADLTQLAGVASAIEATITALDGLRDAFGPLGGVFENIAGLSSDALYSLAESAGGLDALGSSLGSFFKEFYGEAEQVEMQTAAMTTALSEVGLALPESRDAFRAVVEGLDLTSESGREQFGVLMELSGVFAELNPVVAQASDALGSQADAERALADAARIAAGIAQERAGLEQQLLTLQGDTVALREIERAALDESNRALYDQITALQDQQAATAAMTAIAGERAGLEMELLRLQGDTNAIREMERAALDESNRALYDQVNALSDLKDAAAQAAVETANSARAQEESARRLASAAAKANEPITPDKIKQGATALLWLKQIEDVSAQIKSGAKGEDWRLAYERDNANMNRPGSNIGDRIGLWATGWMVKDEAQRQIREAGAAMADAMDQRLRGITESRRGVDPYMQEQDRLLQEQIDGTQDLVDALDEMRRGMLDLKNELIGGALDPSNPALKYASERDFVTGLGRQALTGDMAAAEMFQEQVGGFLQLSQGYNASSTAYAQDFSTMIGLLDQIAASMERQQSTASATLRVQQDGLSQVADNTERTAQATDRQARSASVLEQRAIE
jgi:tape measure domain-containing protein